MRIDILSNSRRCPCHSHGPALFLSALCALGTKVILPLLQIYKVVKLLHFWGCVLVNTGEGVCVTSMRESKRDTVSAAAEVKVQERAAHSRRSLLALPPSVNLPVKTY